MDSNSLLRETISISLILVLGLILFSNTAIASDSGENMTEPEWDEGEEVYLVSNLTELNWIRNAPKEDYKLIDDINATETRNWNNGNGWEPVGEENYEFYGTFDGQNHAIINLTMERPSEEYVGLFGITGSDAEIRNLKLENLSISSDEYSGGLVGVNNGLVEDVEAQVKGEFSSLNGAGGLIGRNYGGDIIDVRVEVDIEGKGTYARNIGGIVGRLSEGSIDSSTAKGKIVSGETKVGGIVGEVSETGLVIVNSNSSVNVQGEEQIGGLVGKIHYGEVKSSYSTGKISGDKEVGGLIGYSNGVVSNSYSESSIEGNRSVGGLVGYNNDDRGSIENSYSVGEIKGDQYAGGLVGWNVGEVSNSFWDTDSSGLDASDAGKGKETNEMQDLWTFTDSTYFEPDTLNYRIEFEEGDKENITLNSKEYTIEFMDSEINQTSSYDYEIEATFLIEGENYTLNESEGITLEPAEVPVSIGGYSYSGNTELDSVTLDFNLNPDWEITEVDTTQDVNESYTWNIVDGETYPFLSWEGSAGETTLDRYKLNVEVEDTEGNSLENASVKIDSYDKETDAEGQALFEDLVESDYTAIVDKEGYHENSSQFSLTEDNQNETVVLEELSSEFNITEVNLSSDNVDKGETLEVNVTVNNTGSEQGKREVDLKVGEELVGTKETGLDSETSEKLSYEFSVDREGEFDVTAEIFEDSKSEGLLVGPKKYDLNLSVTPAEAGSLQPETGNYAYEEGEAVTVDATAGPGWKFKEWDGLDKPTNEVTLTMDEDKDIKAVFEEDIDVNIEEVAVPQTINGEIDFNYQIANQQEEITDNFTVRLNGREVNTTEKTVSHGETVNEEGPNVEPIAGDGSESATLEVEYAGVKDSRSFRIASIQRDLVEGWNYFSLPIATSQTKDIEDVLDQDKINTIWTYENGWKNYYPEAPDNQFDSIRGGQGYIVEAEEDFSITPIVETNLSAVESDDPVKPAQNNLDAGWNLIGSYWTKGITPSDSGAYSSLPEGHIASTLYTDSDGSLSLQDLGNKDIEPGKAYWVSSKDEAAYTKSQEAE